jgi:hypothetical protein
MIRMDTRQVIGALGVIPMSVTARVWWQQRISDTVVTLSGRSLVNGLGLNGGVRAQASAGRRIGSRPGRPTP